MALIKCSECGKEISDKAEACPNCGCPIKTSDKTEMNNLEPENNSQVSKEDSEQLVREDAKTNKRGNKKKTMSKKNKVIICSIAGLVVVGFILGFALTQNLRTYNKADELFTDKKYTEASAIYNELGDYKDAKEKYNECQMQTANDLFAKKKYEEAINIYDDLGDYGNAKEKSKESYYLQAQALFEKEDFAGAEKLYNQIEDYKDTKELLEKCQYAQSVDGMFMVALSKGLVSRWDYSDKDYIKEFGKSEAELNATEYVNMLRKCVNYELDSIGDFKTQKFNDESLGKAAEEYIDLLNDCLSALDYYSMDYNKYSIMWDDLYSKRVLFISKFVNEYGLTVDKEHQNTLDEFLRNASVAEEQNALDEAINNMVSGYTYEMKDYGYGNISYLINMENTTNVTFEYFGCSVDVLDENGTIIYTTYTGEIKNFEPGQKAQLEVYTGVEGASLKLHPNYYAMQ